MTAIMAFAFDVSRDLHLPLKPDANRFPPKKRCNCNTIGALIIQARLPDHRSCAKALG